MELILYSTEHCSLCDEALELIFSMPELAGHSVRVVDVALDEDLLERFGERLPVLEFQVADTAGQVLDWPFDSQTVRGILATLTPS